MRSEAILAILVLVAACKGGVNGATPTLPDLGGGKDGASENCSNGTDDDGDLAVDCGDTDCLGLAVCGGGLSEDCSNGLDDDDNGWTDCDDDACWSASSCGQSVEDICDDGEDNDDDGAKDCEDADCVGSPACESSGTPEDCTNERDDDEDATTDCEDHDCFDHPACQSPEVCDGGEDEDGDGAVDCADADCLHDPACVDEPDQDGGVPELDAGAGGEDGGVPEEDGGVPPGPVCGNRFLEGDEECDDGNHVDDDGCDSDCHIEHDSTHEPADGSVLTVHSGSVVTAAINPAGDDDWYKIELADGDQLTVETSDGNGGCGVDTIMQLFGATQPNPRPTSTSCTTETGAIACNDDGGPGLCSFLDYTATRDGFVHVRVLEFGGNDTGSYRVTFTVTTPPGGDTDDELEPNGTPTLATPIQSGDLIEGTLTPTNDEDYFIVEVNAFDTLRLETSDGQGGCGVDSVLFLYDPLDAPPTSRTCADDDLAFECSDDEGVGNCSLIEHFFWLSGEYTVRLISYNQASSGSYFMSVSIE